MLGGMGCTESQGRESGCLQGPVNRFCGKREPSA